MPDAATVCEGGAADTVKSGAEGRRISMALIVGRPVTGVSVIAMTPPATVTG